MIDFLHLPKPQNGYVDYFPGYSGSIVGSWRVWNKPRGINFIKIICIGGGGSGAGGDSGGGGGGGAGGSGAVYTIMMPAIFLPDRLYVSTTSGGQGGAPDTNGTSSNASQVCIAPENAAIYRVAFANAGAAGQPSALGGGGGAAPAAIANTLQAGQGNFTALGGQTGGNGGDVGLVGVSITYPTTGLLLSGGAGGAGSGVSSGFAGGDITAPASQTSTYTIFPTLPGGAAGSVSGAAGGDGQPGINNMELLLFTGGSGGGSGFGAGSVGGRGGDGGFGCGGGGGGAGTTGGRGGNGGPGLVIISCW